MNTVVQPPDGADVLVLEHVSAAYGPYRALFDVSFSVAAGIWVQFWAARLDIAARKKMNLNA